MFKSCFPNSDLEGNPDDPPLATPDDSLTVANAKAVYNALLTCFATRQDKLFIVITAPPLAEGDTTAAHAANARAFNNWLVNNWLTGYTHHNVAVFDFYNVTIQPIEIALFRRFAPGVGLRRHSASDGAARQGRLINRPYLAKADQWPQAQKGVRARRASPPTVTA